MALKAGVVGLGIIGGGVASCLAREAMLEGVYDVRPDASDGLEGVPAVLGSPKELAARCDVVFIAVVSAAQAKDVITGPTGLLSGKTKGLTIGLLSTVSLTDLRELRQIVIDSGAKFIDSGVTGGTRSAERGLVSLVGAEPGDLEAVLPAYEAFSIQVAHMGGPGTGMAAKIARNVMVYGVWQAGYEGAKLAAAAGIDVRKLADAIEMSAAAVGGPTAWYRRPSPQSDPVEAQFREQINALLDKDLAAALELAEDLGVDLPAATLARANSRMIMDME